MKAVTQWFSRYEKPTRKGIYQKKLKFGLVFQYWDGEKWFGYGWREKEAERLYCLRYESSYQKTPWRGLASKP